MSESSVVVRPRVRDDIAPLGEALMAQQSSTRYPFRDPLPIPVEDFLHASDAVAAWTAEVDGQPVGHVCRVAPLSGFPEAAEMNQACARAHGCEVEQLAWVSTLFVGLAGRGLASVACCTTRWSPTSGLPSCVRASRCCPSTTPRSDDLTRRT